MRSGGFTGRLDDLTGPTVRLVATQPLSPEDRQMLLAGLRPLHGVLVALGDEVRELDDERVLSSWLLDAGTPFAVVRPDHYLYATATTAHEALERIGELQDRLGAPTGGQTPQSIAHHSPAY